jgi:hypothetical protein
MRKWLVGRTAKIQNVVERLAGRDDIALSVLMRMNGVGKEMVGSRKENRNAPRYRPISHPNGSIRRERRILHHPPADERSQHDAEEGEKTSGRKKKVEEGNEGRKRGNEGLSVHLLVVVDPVDLARPVPVDVARSVLGSEDGELGRVGGVVDGL